MLTPFGDVWRCASIAFPINAPLPAEEAVYIGWKGGLDRVILVIEVPEETARDRQIVATNYCVVALITQMGA
jgi:hypothetical protein